MKRLLFFFIAIAACMHVAQAFDFSATVPSGQTLYFSYTSNGKVYITKPEYSTYSYYTTGNLVIPGSIVSNGIRWDIDYIGAHAFDECTRLTLVVVSDSITSIGEYAFYCCTKLSSVSIGNGVTSIGEHAFDFCTKLSSVSIGNGVTSIGSYTFSGCTQLTSVSIGDGANSIGSNAFNNCSSLNTITIYSLNCTATGNSFYGVSANTTVNVPCGTAATYSATTGWSQFNNITEMPAMYTTTVNSSNTTMGTASANMCGNVIAATANNGYHFDHWSDGNTENPRTLILTSDTALIACFVPNRYAVSVSTSGRASNWLHIHGVEEMAGYRMGHGILLDSQSADGANDGRYAVSGCIREDDTYRNRHSQRHHNGLRNRRWRGAVRLVDDTPCICTYRLPLHWLV